MSAGEPKHQDSLESALQDLKPAAPAFDRDRLMFRAGQVSARSTGWRASALTALVGIVVGTVGAYATLRATWQPDIQYVEIKVTVPAPAPVEVKQPSPAVTPVTPPGPELAATSPWQMFGGAGGSAGGYLHLRDQVLRWGVEAMPSATPASAQNYTGAPSSVWQMQSDLYGNADGL